MNLVLNYSPSLTIPFVPSIFLYVHSVLPLPFTFILHLLGPKAPSPFLFLFLPFPSPSSLLVTFLCFSSTLSLLSFSRFPSPFLPSLSSSIYSSFLSSLSPLFLSSLLSLPNASNFLSSWFPLVIASNYSTDGFMQSGTELQLLSEWGVPILFRLFSLDDILLFFNALLLEKSVVFISDNPGILSAAV